MFDARQLGPALTKSEMELRDAFVSQYLVDFNAYRACLRLGFQPTYALTWERTFTECGYVQRAIAHFTRKPLPGSEEEKQAAYEANLLELTHNGTSASRVSALRLYGDYKGWNKKTGEGDAADALIAAMRDFAQQAPA